MPTPTPTPEAVLGQVPTPPPPPNPAGMPVGNGMFALAHYKQFVAQLNTSNQQYWSLFDDALQQSPDNALRARNDPVIAPCLEVRAYPTALLPGDVQPEDPDDEEEVGAAKRVTADVRSMLGFAAMRRALLTNATWAGVSGCQFVYNWVSVKRKLRMRPVEWEHIDGDSLSFDWAKWPSIRVTGAGVGLPKDQLVPTERGMAYRLTPTEREQVLIHRFNPEAADYWRPQNARTIVGSGLRQRLYLLWALKSQIWQMGLDWLRWFARGVTVWYYEDGNDAHLRSVTQAVQTQDGSYAMLYPLPKGRVGESPYFQKPFEHIAANSSNAQFMQQLLTSYLDDMLRFGILHQSLTTQVGPSGLGSGAVADNHQTTFDNLVKMDALLLDDSITRDVIRVLYRVNEPGITPGRWVSQIDSPNVAQLMESAQTIVGLGGSVPMRPLTEAAGIPENKEGDTLLGGMQPGQPAAVTNIPDGVPMVGAAPSGTQPAMGGQPGT